MDEQEAGVLLANAMANRGIWGKPSQPDRDLGACFVEVARELGLAARVVGEDAEPPAAPVPSEEPLPEGCFASPDGRLWWPKGAPWPDGYERRANHGWTTMQPNTPKDGIALQVRPVSPVPPEPEMVGLHELIGRTLPGCDWSVDLWEMSGDEDAVSGTAYRLGDGEHAEFFLDSSGRVAVLPLSDEERR